MDVFDKIIRENCWKFSKGYPDDTEAAAPAEEEEVDVNVDVEA